VTLSSIRAALTRGLVGTSTTMVLSATETSVSLTAPHTFPVGRCADLARFSSHMPLNAEKCVDTVKLSPDLVIANQSFGVSDFGYGFDNDGLLGYINSLTLLGNLLSLSIASDRLS
jgi:hypothetical protein